MACTKSQTDGSTAHAGRKPRVGDGTITSQEINDYQFKWLHFAMIH